MFVFNFGKRWTFYFFMYLEIWFANFYISLPRKKTIFNDVVVCKKKMQTKIVIS